MNKNIIKKMTDKKTNEQRKAKDMNINSDISSSSDFSSSRNRKLINEFICSQKNKDIYQRERYPEKTISQRKESISITQRPGQDSSISMSECSMSNNHAYYESKYMKKNTYQNKSAQVQEDANNLKRQKKQVAIGYNKIQRIPFPQKQYAEKANFSKENSGINFKSQHQDARNEKRNSQRTNMIPGNRKGNDNIIFNQAASSGSRDIINEFNKAIVVLDKASQVMNNNNLKFDRLNNNLESFIKDQKTFNQEILDLLKGKKI